MRRFIFRILLLLSLLSQARPSGAQQHIFTNYTVNDGLVNNFIRCIFQDSKGFIWIGTWEGLSKYDGHKFTNYTTDRGLRHALINDIYETPDGKIYIACNDGSLELIEKNSDPQPVPGSQLIINRLVKVNGNKILALTDYQGIHEFRNGKFSKPGQPHPNHNYYDLISFNDTLYLAQSDSATQLLNHRYELYSEWREKFGLFAECKVLQDSKNRTWLGTVFGLKLLSPYQERGRSFQFLDLPPSFDHPVLKKDMIMDIMEDTDGSIWIATSTALVQVRSDGTRIVSTENDGLPASGTSCLLQDKEKNIWIGTSHGVSKLIARNSVHVYTQADGLSSNWVTNIFPLSDDRMLVNTPEGMQVYDRNNHLFVKASTSPEFFNQQMLHPQLSFYKNENTNRLWLVTTPRNLDEFYHGYNFTGLNGLIRDQHGNYFYAGVKGLLVGWDMRDWDTLLMKFDTYTCWIDRSKTLWVGSRDSGVFRVRYEHADNKIRIVSTQRLLPKIGVRSLFEDRKGNIWIGTRYHGVYRISFDAKGNPLKQHFDQARGLSSNRITAIGEDPDGAIWLSFYNGLDKLIPRDKTYRVFNFSRYNNFFPIISGFIFDRDGTLWMGTNRGLVSIADGKLENSSPLSTHITLAVMGDSLYRLIPSKSISLKPKHRQVHFEFTAPGFINEKQNFYSYRLLGSNNEDWTPASTQHSVSYANLRPGDYRFEVRSQGWNGDWGEATGVEFSVLPPFWQTWWFRSICGVLVAGIIVVVVKARIKRIRHEAELKHKVAETEMAALRAQMNPHFIFNSLNSIENFIMQNEKKLASDYLNKFSKLIRGILDSSRNELIPFEKDMELLQLYIDLEQLRFFNKFKAGIRADPELLQGDYKVPSLLIQPYLENAIVHGIAHSERTDLELNVIAELKDNQICYTIEDNGVGREQAAVYKQHNKPHHHSVGLKITGERIAHFNQREHMNGDVVITDLVNEKKQPAGTRVQVTIRAN